MDWLNYRALLAATLILAVGLAGCDSEDSTPLEPTGPEPFTPSALRGHAAFVASCAPCHSTRDGFDLAFFAFTDTTIVRRAVNHVDTATALDIVAHIRSLDVKPVTRHVRPFQPRG
ncbi:MAG: hypothetical protein HY702_06705, partial [Gemmatimonadetes bacterium]|nr:hypothetical protein [Gemmatimonadota bacterium]